VLTSSLLEKAHYALYSRLDEADRLTEDGHVVVPGSLRTDNVTVNRHQAPTAASIPAFLARIDQVYGKPWTLDTQLVAAACAHHRVAWVHPFRDGNGRAVRLQTHSALWSLSSGLWSVNRGLARRREEYYARLSEADMARQGDLDGRGNLSQRMLVQWCEFFIEICEDQVKFMEAMLDLGEFKRRLHALVLVRSQVDKSSGYRAELVIPLHYALTSGPMTRGEFVQMTGLGERTARNLLQRLLFDGLLISDTPRGDVRLGFPLSSLSVLFPNLYPEAATTPIEG
jgi:Fic family protein